jgi:23S rRNA pseudouridine1911/1915/1917 synthase
MEFLVPSEKAGARLDHYLSGELPGLSRSRIQALIKAGHALLNGHPAKTGAKIKTGDRVDFNEPPAVPDTNLPEEIPLSILFEDDDLVVVNKPPGMVVHPAAGNREHTLVNALLHHCKTLSGIGGAQRPGIVHRLDKDTSGCLVVAKNDAAHQNLSEQFAGRSVSKIYLALVTGVFKKKTGIIETAIGRHPVHRKKMAVVSPDRGRAAKTAYRVLQAPGPFTVVECTLHTGRTHQIRVHLKHLGHPLLGDALYGSKPTADFPRQMLHAWKLGFFHPRTEEWMEFKAAAPEDFVKLEFKI